MRSRCCSGLRLGFAQGLGADDVELHVVAVHFEVAADEVRPFVQAFFRGDQRRA